MKSSSSGLSQLTKTAVAIVSFFSGMIIVMEGSSLVDAARDNIKTWVVILLLPVLQTRFKYKRVFLHFPAHRPSKRK